MLHKQAADETSISIITVCTALEDACTHHSNEEDYVYIQFEEKSAEVINCPNECDFKTD